MSMTARKIASVAALLASLGWPIHPARALGQCATYDGGTQVGTISSYLLNEASAMAASQANPGIYWTLADYGNPAYVYALDEDGTLEDILFVSGTLNVDWEDLAVGPCHQSCSCLYIADSGLPPDGRDGGTVYRVSEPIVGETSDVTAAAEALPYLYPDGPHDAESLLVDPRGGDIYIVTKEDDGHNIVYRFPSLEPSLAAVTLERVAEAVLYGASTRDRRATGGAVAPDGGRLAIRSEDQVQEYTIPEGAPLEAAFALTPLLITPPDQPQGEGISYSADGTALVLSSEQIPSPIYRLDCTQGSAAAAPIEALTAACPDATDSGPVYGCSSAPAACPPGAGGWGFALMMAGWLRVRRRSPS